jgi:DNA-binding IclR family transcriptional regulator
VEGQSLQHALAALSAVVQSNSPVTATYVAQVVGVHQSTASRILTALKNAGYVRKVGPQRFSPDYGLLVMGLNAAQHFPIMVQPRLALEHAAKTCSGLAVSLAIYWRARLLYFIQASRDMETRTFEGHGFPLHLSSPGLLFLLNLPEERAITILHSERERLGWQRPTSHVPPTERDVLLAARVLYRDNTLVLRNWQHIGHVTAAVTLPELDGVPLALTISGASDVFTDEAIRIRLLEARQIVSSSIPYGK